MAVERLRELAGDRLHTPLSELFKFHQVCSVVVPTSKAYFKEANDESSLALITFLTTSGLLEPELVARFEGFDQKSALSKVDLFLQVWKALAPRFTLGMLADACEVANTPNAVEPVLRLL